MDEYFVRQLPKGGLQVAYHTYHRLQNYLMTRMSVTSHTILLLMKRFHYQNTLCGPTLKELLIIQKEFLIID